MGVHQIQQKLIEPFGFGFCSEFLYRLMTLEFKITNYYYFGTMKLTQRKTICL